MVIRVVVCRLATSRQDGLLTNRYRRAIVAWFPVSVCLGCMVSISYLMVGRRVTAMGYRKNPSNPFQDSFSVVMVLTDRAVSAGAITSIANTVFNHGCVA